MIKSGIVSCTLLVTVASLFFTKCFQSDNMTKEMEPVFQGVQCLSAFYKENKRLPEDNNELELYAKKNKIGLDLSKFKTFHYYQKSDTTFVIDYELLPPSQVKGTFEFKPGKK